MNYPTPNASHERRCHDCGNVAIHADRITPWVLCSRCGSQDTRVTAKPIPHEPTVPRAVADRLADALRVVVAISDRDHAAWVEAKATLAAYEATK